MVADVIAGRDDALRTVQGWLRSQLAKQLRMIPPEHLEDLEQDILLSLLEDLDQGRFRGASRFETYVRSYARFRAIDFLRARGRRRFAPIEPEDEPAAHRLHLPEVHSPADQLLDKETRAQLNDLLDGLGEDCRRLWNMLLDGMSYQEMADAVSVRAATLRVRVHRCRERAQKKWQEIVSGL